MNNISCPAVRRAVSRLVMLLAVSGVLASCAEDDVILPGKREDIRSVLTDAPESEIAIAAQENTVRPISLGAQSNNASWTQGIGTPATRTAHPALRSPLTLAWSTKIGEGDSRKARITAQPVVAAGRVFTLDARTQVSAVSTAGELLWQRNIDSARGESDDATGGGLAYADGRLFVSLGLGELVALDAATGAEIWRQDLDSTGSGAPTVSGGLIYIVSGDETGWAISTDNGRVVWQLLGPPDNNNVLGAPPPALGNDFAIFGFGSGELQAVFRRGGLRRWSASVLGQRPGAALGNVGDVTGAPVISGSTVYAGNQAGRTVALDLASGDRKWTAPDGAIGPIVPAGDSVFFLTDLAQLVRVGAADGVRIWAADLPKFVRDRPRKRYEVFAHHGPILAGGRIHVASNDGLLRSFDPTNGALAGSVEIPDGASTDPVVAGGALYVVSTKGQLHAFR